MTTIDFTRCPLCQSEWIYTDHDLVCEKCKPKVNVDLAIVGLHKSIDTLEQHHLCDLLPRKTILTKLADRLNTLLNNVE